MIRLRQIYRVGACLYWNRHHNPLPYDEKWGVLYDKADETNKEKD